MVQTANTKDMYYTCTDYLDNINLVINQSKTVAQENSFDAWGRRRNVNTWSHTNVTNPTLLQRGYTGHEHLDDFGLINMNARLYDPLIGRMLSPDNVLFDVTNSQNYNKYTYVLNNPLRYTDPTGNVQVGGPAAPPKGLSGEGFHIAYNEFKTQTAQEEKNQMLEQLLMDAGGGGASSDGDPIIPRGQANQSWIGEIGFGSRLTPNSKASMRQTDAYLYIGQSGINNNRSRVKNAQNGGGLPQSMGEVNTGIGAFMLANGTKTEIMDFAIRSNYKSAQTWVEFNKLRPTQQAWRTTNTLGRTGSQYLKYAKGLGYVGAGLSTTYSIVNAGSYYYNGGGDWQIGAKATLDVIMTGVGFLGPVGFGVSATYFILDNSTGNFGGFGQIKP